MRLWIPCPTLRVVPRASITWLPEWEGPITIALLGSSLSICPLIFVLMACIKMVGALPALSKVHSIFKRRWSTTTDHCFPFHFLWIVSIQFKTCRSIFTRVCNLSRKDLSVKVFTQSGTLSCIENKVTVHSYTCKFCDVGKTVVFLWCAHSFVLGQHYKPGCNVCICPLICVDNAVLLLTNVKKYHWVY